MDDLADELVATQAYTREEAACFARGVARTVGLERFRAADKLTVTDLDQLSQLSRACRAVVPAARSGGVTPATGGEAGAGAAVSGADQAVLRQVAIEQLMSASGYTLRVAQCIVDALVAALGPEVLAADAQTDPDVIVTRAELARQCQAQTVATTRR